MKKYGLIGYPLGHSFSKNFFNEKFHSENIDAEYVNFEIPSIKELPSVLLANPDLVGLNVTIPYKEQVISYLDELDKEATEEINTYDLSPSEALKMRQPSEPSM